MIRRVLLGLIVQTRNQSFEGTVSGNSMKGQCDYGAVGAGTFEGKTEWARGLDSGFGCAILGTPE